MTGIGRGTELEGVASSILSSQHHVLLCAIRYRWRVRHPGLAFLSCPKLSQSPHPPPSSLLHHQHHASSNARNRPRFPLRHLGDAELSSITRREVPLSGITREERVVGDVTFGFLLKMGGWTLNIVGCRQGTCTWRQSYRVLGSVSLRLRREGLGSDVPLHISSSHSHFLQTSSHKRSQRVTVLHSTPPTHRHRWKSTLDGRFHPVDDGSHLGWEHVRMEIGTCHCLPGLGFGDGYLLCLPSDVYQEGWDFSVGSD